MRRPTTDSGATDNADDDVGVIDVSGQSKICFTLIFQYSI